MANVNNLIVTGSACIANTARASKFIGDGSEITNIAAANLPNSGVTAGSYGPSANTAPSFGGTFSVPYITFDNKGRATAASTKTITVPSLPVRLQEYRTTATTIDTTVTGFSYVNESNSPFKSFHTSNTDYMILTQGYSTIWGSQIATDFRSNNLAVRTKNNGTWSSWSLVSLDGHTHSYLPLSGGTVTGTISSSVNTSRYINGNKGINVIINSTDEAGAYTMLVKMNSTNGYFTHGSHKTRYVLNYTDKATVEAETNSVTKNATLLDESGNASWPGKITGNSMVVYAEAADAILEFDRGGGNYFGWRIVDSGGFLKFQHDGVTRKTFVTHLTLPKTASTSSYDEEKSILTDNDIVVKGSNTQGPKICVSNGTQKVGIHVGSGGTNRGLYDFAANQWLIYNNGTNTILNGNASTATKLATARTLNTISFDGSANKIIPVQFCYHYDDSSDATTVSWHKVASTSTTSTNDDKQITFYVVNNYSDTRTGGILKAYVRSGSTAGSYNKANLIWELKSSDAGMALANFVLVYTTNTTDGVFSAELWCKIAKRYESLKFVVLSMSDRTGKGNPNDAWTLYNTTDGVSAYTSGTKAITSTLGLSTVPNTISRALYDTDGSDWTNTIGIGWATLPLTADEAGELACFTTSRSTVQGSPTHHIKNLQFSELKKKIEVVSTILFSGGTTSSTANLGYSVTDYQRLKIYATVNAMEVVVEIPALVGITRTIHAATPSPASQTNNIFYGVCWTVADKSVSCAGGKTSTLTSSASLSSSGVATVIKKVVGYKY